MKFYTLVHLKFILSTAIVVFFFNIGFGKNDSDNSIKSNGLHKVNLRIDITNFVTQSTLYEINEGSHFMEDTICTSITNDTFFVNSVPKALTYSWSIPTGAVITSTIGDTMIIIDWTNAEPGLGNICIETANDCNTSTPLCIPYYIDICNDAPSAINDLDTTLSNTAIIVDVQANDIDLDNDILTTSLDPTNTPMNGILSIFWK